MEVRDQLSDIIKGITRDLQLAEEMLSLSIFVNEELDHIKQASFGTFFETLQIIVFQSIFLTLAKIFQKKEKDNTKKGTKKRSHYPTRSIPSAINFLMEHKDKLYIAVLYNL